MSAEVFEGHHKAGLQKFSQTINLFAWPSGICINSHKYEEVVKYWYDIRLGKIEELFFRSVIIYFADIIGYTILSYIKISV